jgi:chitinase
MKFTRLILLLPFTFSLGSCQPSGSDSDLAIMGYYVPPREDYQPQDLPLGQLTHIIYSFTEVIDNEMKFPRERHDTLLRQLVDQRPYHPDVKYMIACGGWGGSGGFSDMAATLETRTRFIESVIRFLEEYELDGVDMDWEYPGLPGAGNPHMDADRENFTALMKGLREAMDATGKKYILTFASAGWEKYYDYVDLEEVMKYADYMNVMTYDLVGGHTPVTGHHTNLGWIRVEDLEGTPAMELLKQMEEEVTPGSTEKIIAYCMDLGVDPAQMVVGAAFYGKGWVGVPADNNGLYQPNRGGWNNWLAYSRIREEYENKNGFSRYWDPKAKAPYLFNAADSLFITYDDTMSVRLKTEYAMDLELGGIMFWQLRLDTGEDGLLDAIHKAARE